MERSKDPGGSRPQVAPVVVENYYPSRAVVNKYAGRIAPGCDGRTPALCPNEESPMDAGDGWGILGYGSHGAAYIWFADNSKTGYFTLARYMIKHVKRSTCRYYLRNLWCRNEFPIEGARPGLIAAYRPAEARQPHFRTELDWSPVSGIRM